MTGFWGEGAWGLIVYPIDCSHLGILCNTPPHGICPIGIASLASRGGSCGCVGVEIHPRNLLISEKEKNFFILISDPAIILLK